MKKSFLMILSVALLLTFLFASCGETEESKKGENTNTLISVDGDDSVIDDLFDIVTEANAE